MCILTENLGGGAKGYQGGRMPPKCNPEMGAVYNSNQSDSNEMNG